MELLVKAAEQHTSSTNDDENDIDEIDGFTISAFNEKPVQRIEQPKCTSVQISRDISDNISQDIPDELKDFNKSGPKDPAPNPVLKKIDKDIFLKIWDNIIKPELNGKELLKNISHDLISQEWLDLNIKGKKK